MFTLKMPWFGLALIAMLPGSSMAGIVTMTFTQFFDYQGIGISGKPSATWTGTFDLATHPTYAFSGDPVVNSDFLTNHLSFQGTPALAINVTWSGDTVTQIIGPGVKVGSTSLVPFGYYYVAFPSGYSGMPTDAIWLAAVPPSTVRNATTSQLNITTASTTVPEPSTFAAFLAIGVVLIGRNRFRIC